MPIGVQASAHWCQSRQMYMLFFTVNWETKIEDIIHPDVEIPIFKPWGFEFCWELWCRAKNIGGESGIMPKELKTLCIQCVKCKNFMQHLSISWMPPYHCCEQRKHGHRWHQGRQGPCLPETWGPSEHCRRWGCLACWQRRSSKALFEVYELWQDCDGRLETLPLLLFLLIGYTNYRWSHRKEKYI